MTTAAERAAPPDPVPGGAADDRAPDTSTGDEGFRRQAGSLPVLVVQTATAALFALVAMAAFFYDEQRSQDFDPQFMRVLVERSMAFHSNFYVAGIHNKGPLEPLVYRLAAAVGSHDGFWYAIAAFVVVAAFACAAAACSVVRAMGARRGLAVAAGAALFVHLTLSGADYAGVLYARNITIALLALAVVVTVSDRAWSSPVRSGLAAATIGVLLGLVAQTLLTEGLACAAVYAIAASWRRDVRWGSIGARFAIIVAAVVTFASAPFAYAVTGSAREFFDGWWRYAGFMSEGTGRSVRDQIGLGWHQGYVYYQARPLALVVVVAAVVLAIITWRRTPRRVRALQLGLLGWWAAAWIELTASQRYSSHYFSVLALPTALLAVAVGVSLVRLVGEGVGPLPTPVSRWTVAAPALAVVLALYLGSTTSLRAGLRAQGDFDGVGAEAAKREQTQGGTVRTVRAVLDLVSSDGDPLLAWTNYPWTYLDVDRVAATRFIWKSFLIGEIYLGRTSTDYVLADTWTDFETDLRQSDPAALVTLTNTPVDVDTPFATYADREFSEAYAGPVEQVHLRRAIFDELVGDRAATPWTAPSAGPATPPATGWAIGPGGLEFTPTGTPAPLVLDGDARCERLDGTITTAGSPGFAFVFDDASGGAERVRLGIEGAQAYSASDQVRFESVPMTGSGPIQFSLIVGDRSAALVVGGRIVAALRLGGEPSNVTLLPEGGALTVTNLTHGGFALGDCAGPS